MSEFITTCPECGRNNDTDRDATFVLCSCDSRYRVTTARPDAVTEGNALCQAIRERDELRKRVAELESERDAVVAAFSQYATLRDQVSMRALQGLLAHNGEDDSCSAVREALRYADAFLKERSR